MIAAMLEHKQPRLMPTVAPFDGYVEEAGRVSSTCLVTAGRNHYSVPCELAGKLIARFPAHRDLAGFDFGQSCVDRGLIENLADLAFTEQAHNVVFIGSSVGRERAKAAWL